MQLTARQVEFADAALAVLAHRGMGGVTFRAVAAEAGTSLGALQKAFGSKKLLLKAMFHRMRDNASSAFLGEPGRPTLRGWLIELMLAILPLDEARRAAELHGVAFTERAATEVEFGEAVAASDRELVEGIAALVRRSIAEGELTASAEPERVARAWLALGQGLAAQLLYDPRPEAEVRADVEYVVARLLD